METRKKESFDFNIIAIACLILIIGFNFYYWWNARFPYYVSWDMDLTTTIDSYLIHSNLLPAHFAHTAFGIYFIINITQYIAHSLGFLSFLTLNDLQNSLNPILGVAETTNFIRAHNPFITILFVLFQTASFYVLFENQRARSLLFLLVAITETSLIYISYWVRSELYALMFWSMALLLVALAVRATHFRNKIRWLFLTGIALGLCFTTKVQSIFYLACFPLLALMMEASRNYPSLYLPLSEKKIDVFKQIACLTMLVFTILTVGGLLIQTHYVAHFRDYFGMSIQWSAMFLVLLAIVISFNFKNKPVLIANSSFYVTTIVAGFLFTFFLTLSMYPASMRVGLIHTALMFKITMLGIVSDAVSPESNIKHISSFKANINEYILLYSLLFVTYVCLLLGKLTRLIRISNIILVAPLLIMAIHLVLLFLGIRQDTSRDAIWNEALPTYLLAILLFMMAENIISKLKPLAASLGAICLVMLIVINFYRSPILAEQPYAKSFQFQEGQDTPFLKDVYGGNQVKYTEVMNDFYHNAKIANAALWQARELPKIQSQLKLIFPHQRIDLKNTTLGFNGFLVNTQPLKLTVSNISNQLSFSTIIRLNSNDNKLLTDLVKLNFDNLKDISIYLFITSNDKSPLSITLKDNSGKKYYYRGRKLDKDNASLALSNRNNSEMLLVISS